MSIALYDWFTCVLLVAMVGDLILLILLDELCCCKSHFLVPPNSVGNVLVFTIFIKKSIIMTVYSVVEIYIYIYNRQLNDVKEHYY